MNTNAQNTDNTKTAKNPFKALAEFYKETLEQKDADGYSEVCTLATEKLLTAVATHDKNFPITVEDVSYHDGYCIFAHGTNSVVHFHVKETPGWKYGIWWDRVKDFEKSTKKKEVYFNDRLAYTFFAQYEETLDKFKPSASMVTTEGHFYLNDNSPWVRSICEHIKFIHDEPYLAFYRDMHYTDYNTEHVSKAKAKYYFFKEHFRMKLEKWFTETADKYFLSWIKSILKRYFEPGTALITNRANNCYPAYDIIVKNPWEDLEDGWYGLDELLDPEIYATYDRKVAVLEKLANVFNVYWSFPCHCSAHLMKPERFDRLIVDCGTYYLNNK